MIPALWLDLINARDPNTPSPAMSLTFPEGAFPMSLPPCKIVGSATYLLVSMAEAKVAGSFPKSQAVPGDHLSSTPPGPTPTLCLQRQRLTRTTGDTGSLGFSLISSWKQSPPG